MRYLITGGSGYIGSRLIEILGARDEVERIVNLDVRPPARSHPKVTFVRGDVRDIGATRDLLEREEPDALVHLAFLLNPIRDEARMYDIDVNGTEAVLRAAAEAGTQQVLVTSSATAYGAFPDNPRPIAEDWPVRGQPDFSYARDKAEADRLCQLWALEHPERVMTIVRPCIVFGPNVDNYISRAWEKSAFMPIMDGVDEEFQLVHEDDVVSAITGLLDAKAGGRVQRRRRRLPEMGGVRADDRAEDAGDVVEDGAPHLLGGLGAAFAEGRGAARQPELHPLSVGGLEREAQGGDRLGALGRHTRGLHRDHVRERVGGDAAVPGAPPRIGKL